MTREETKEVIKVMQAYVDGKDIEYKNHLSREMIDYELVDGDPLWDWNSSKYRIKEEPTKYDEMLKTTAEMRKVFEAIKENVFKEESKPFDWRVKNIQWVRNIGEIDSVHRVECMDSKGILYTRHSAGPYQMFVELDKLQKLEWSEDNATWRRFE